MNLPERIECGRVMRRILQRRQEQKILRVPIDAGIGSEMLEFNRRN